MEPQARTKTLLKIGELARRTGLTVRTLRHYDTIDLLPPATRTASAHRLYGRQELLRLQQILSLRQLGLSLDEIRACLERPSFSLARVVQLHLAALGDRIEKLERLRSRLERLAGRLRSSDPLPIDELTRTIEEITRMEKYYTAEQLRYLEDRRQLVGDERISEAQREWVDLFARFRTALEGGEDPASESVLALARKARDLIAEFTGGDAGITASLARMHRDDPRSMYDRWGVEPEVAEYMGCAMRELALHE